MTVYTGILQLIETKKDLDTSFRKQVLSMRTDNPLRPRKNVKG